MQNIIIDKPYQFVPPFQGAFWPWILNFYLPYYLRKAHGVVSTQFLGTDKLRQSLAAGHGIILAPNHCRPCDPLIVGLLARSLSANVYLMASWHLFMQGPLLAFLLPRLGVFSMHREGLDREAIKCAVNLLTAAARPLVIFPEGVVSRTNDRVNHLMEGTVFMARHAAKQRAALNPAGKVVIHPVAIRYFFSGDLNQAISPALEDIEKRLSWRPQKELKIIERIRKIGDALLSLKEIEYFGKPVGGSFEARLSSMIEHILLPLEIDWLGGKKEGEVVGRVKALRSAILPEMISGDIGEDERARRWKQLADLYFAQQLYFYPPGYFGADPAPERILETVERFEEDLTDRARVYSPIHAVAEVGDALEVSPNRQRGAESDPVMTRLRTALETMLENLKGQRDGSAGRNQ